MDTYSQAVYVINVRTYNTMLIITMSSPNALGIYILILNQYYECMYFSSRP